MDSAITSVATPAATPRIENSVTSRSTAGRYGERKYRRATNHSNRMVKSHQGKDTLCAARTGSGVLPRLRARNSGKRITSRIDCESVSSMVSRSMPMPSPAVGGMRVAQCANVIHVQLLRDFFSALRNLREESALLLGGIVQLRKPVGNLHTSRINLESLRQRRIVAASVSRAAKCPSENRKESWAESACLPPWFQTASPSIRHPSACPSPRRKPPQWISPRRYNAP